MDSTNTNTNTIDAVAVAADDTDDDFDFVIDDREENHNDSNRTDHNDSSSNSNNQDISVSNAKNDIDETTTSSVRMTKTMTRRMNDPNPQDSMTLCVAAEATAPEAQNAMLETTRTATNDDGYDDNVHHSQLEQQQQRQQRQQRPLQDDEEEVFGNDDDRRTSTTTTADDDRLITTSNSLHSCRNNDEARCCHCHRHSQQVQHPHSTISSVVHGDGETGLNNNTEKNPTTTTAAIEKNNEKDDDDETLTVDSGNDSIASTSSSSSSSSSLSPPKIQPPPPPTTTTLSRLEDSSTSTSMPKPPPPPPLPPPVQQLDDSIPIPPPTTTFESPPTLSSRKRTEEEKQLEEEEGHVDNNIEQDNEHCSHVESSSSELPPPPPAAAPAAGAAPAAAGAAGLGDDNNADHHTDARSNILDSPKTTNDDQNSSLRDRGCDSTSKTPATTTSVTFATFSTPPSSPPPPPRPGPPPPTSATTTTTESTAVVATTNEVTTTTATATNTSTTATTATTAAAFTEPMDEIDVITTMFAAAELTTHAEVTTSSKNGSATATTISNTVGGGSETPAASDSASSSLVAATATTSTVERTIDQENPRGLSPPPSPPPPPSSLPVINNSRDGTTTRDTCNEKACTSSDQRKQPLSLSRASSQTPTNNGISDNSTSPSPPASPPPQHQESCDQKNLEKDDENSQNDNNVHDDGANHHSSVTKLSDNESGSGDTRTEAGSSTPALQPASSTVAPLPSTPIDKPEQEQQEECTISLTNAAYFPSTGSKDRKKQDDTNATKESSSSNSLEQTNGDFATTATTSTKNRETATPTAAATATPTARRYPDTVRPLWWVRDIRRGKITAVKSGGGYAQMSFSTKIDIEKKKRTKLKTEVEQLNASFNDISQQHTFDDEDTPSRRPIRQSTSIQRALGSNWRFDDTLQLNQRHLQHQQQQQRSPTFSSQKRKSPPGVSTGVSAETAIELDLTDEASVASSTYLSSSSSSSSLLSSEAPASVDVDVDADIDVEEGCDDIGDDIYTGSDVKIFPTLYRKKSIDPVTKLPVEDFAVCKVDDDPKTPKYIYKFRSFVAKSRIDAECAGNGAFIAFIGAWERPTGEKSSLTDTKQPSASDVVDPLSIVNGDDLRLLLALHPMGFNINIFLRLQDTLLNPLPPSQTYHIDWDHQGRSDDDTPLTHVVDVSSYTKEVKGIKEFSVTGQGPAMLELGLYGPRSPSERLKDWEFELKNWIFSSLPGLYAFASHEFLRGRNASDPPLNDINQMFDWHPRNLQSFSGETFHSTHLQRDPTLLIPQTLDITSNYSGRPSKLSQFSIPMHVNEAGYGKSGHPKSSNTIVFNAGERKTHYLYRGRKLQKITPFSMQRNSVELKVNYGHGYEKYRERKGYGLRNLKGSVLSDQNRPSLLLRNLADRNGAIETFDCLGIRQFYETLEFLETEIHSKIIDRFSRRLLLDRQLDELCTLPTGLDSPDVTVEQLVALRRLHWLGAALRNHLQCLQDSGATSRTKSCLVEQCRATIHTLENEAPISSAIQSWPDVISFVRNHDYIDSHGKSFKDALENELEEEVLFTLRSDLVYPYDEGTWCPIACRLIERLCEATLRESDRLFSEYFNLAVEAKERILDENTPLKDLALSADVANKRYGLKAAKNRSGTTGDLSCVVVHSLPRPVTKIVSTDSDEGSATRRSTSLSICDEWYLSRQVLFIVDAFAKKNLSESKRIEFTESLLAHVATHSTWQTIHQFLSESMIIEGEVAERAFGGITQSRFQSGWQNDQEALPPWVGSDGSTSSETTDRAFYELVLPILERKLGWTVEYGDPDWDDQKRTDGLHFCAFPPGISRHEDCSLFRPHINYFASQTEVISRLEREVLPWARFCADYDNTLKNQRGLTFNEVDELFALWHRNKEVRKRKRKSSDAERTLVEDENCSSTQDENGPQKILLNYF